VLVITFFPTPKCFAGLRLAGIRAPNGLSWTLLGNVWWRPCLMACLGFVWRSAVGTCKYVTIKAVLSVLGAIPTRLKAWQGLGLLCWSLTNGAVFMKRNDPRGWVESSSERKQCLLLQGRFSTTRSEALYTRTCPVYFRRSLAKSTAQQTRPNCSDGQWQTPGTLSWDDCLRKKILGFFASELALCRAGWAGFPPLSVLACPK